MSITTNQYKIFKELATEFIVYKDSMDKEGNLYIFIQDKLEDSTKANLKNIYKNSIEFFISQCGYAPEIKSNVIKILRNTTSKKVA